MSSVPTRSVPAAPSTAVPDLHVLQSGMGWFPEQAGGLNRMVYHLTRHLPGAGVRVTGLVTGADAVRADSGGAVRAFAPTAAPMPVRWWRARAAARQVLRTSDVDLAAVHFALYAQPWVGGLSADVPVVFHFHGPWADESAVEGGGGASVRFKAWIERQVVRRSDAFIVLSRAFADVLQRVHGVAPDRIHRVPGGVDVDAFDTGLGEAEARQHLGWPTDRPIVLVVRRLARRMGHEALLDALPAIRAAVPDVLLLIAGKGPLAGELQARIDAAGLDDHVRLLGFVPDADLPAAYTAATLSVVPTQALEGFGLITIESLAAGTPPLVTPVGGLPEGVRELSEGLVMDGTAPDAIASALTDALVGRRPLPTAEACRAFARARYDWPVIARQTRAVYDRVLR